MALYLDHILPGIVQPGSDNNFGSSALADVLALQVGAAATHPVRNYYLSLLDLI